MFPPVHEEHIYRCYSGGIHNRHLNSIHPHTHGNINAQPLETVNINILKTHTPPLSHGSNDKLNSDICPHFMPPLHLYAFNTKLMLCRGKIYKFIKYLDINFYC